MHQAGEGQIENIKVLIHVLCIYLLLKLSALMNDFVLYGESVKFPQAQRCLGKGGSSYSVLLQRC